jgi:hypothetical protein
VNRSDLVQYLEDLLADDGAAFGLAELARVVDRGVLDYGLLVPYQAEGTLDSTTGTTDYDLPAALIELLSVTSSAGTALAFTRRNRQVRLDADPGDDTLALDYLATYPYTAATESWDDIPDYHLTQLGDLCHAHCLEALADEVDRRPAIRDGQTSEDWGNTARNLRTKARAIRQAARDALTIMDPFVG